MKRKIAYILFASALVMSAFLIGKITAPTVVKTEVISSETKNPDMLNRWFRILLGKIKWKKRIKAKEVQDEKYIIYN